MNLELFKIVNTNYNIISIDQYTKFNLKYLVKNVENFLTGSDYIVKIPLDLWLDELIYHENFEYINFLQTDSLSYSKIYDFTSEKILTSEIVILKYDNISMIFDFVKNFYDILVIRDIVKVINLEDMNVSYYMSYSSYENKLFRRNKKIGSLD